MVPPYRSAFSLSRLLKATMTDPDSVKVEPAYAEASGTPDAVLLPSARPGISWTLRVCGCRDEQVLCPVVTCWEVWQAVLRARAHLCLIDLSEGSFLMDYSVLASFQNCSRVGAFSNIWLSLRFGRSGQTIHVRKYGTEHQAAVSP